MNLLDFGEIWSRDLNARLTLQPQGLECPPSQQDSTPKGIEDFGEGSNCFSNCQAVPTGLHAERH